MPQVITFDKFIRWSLMALAAVAVFLIIKGLSEVLLPFFMHGPCLPALPYRKVRTIQTTRTWKSNKHYRNTCLCRSYHHGNLHVYHTSYARSGGPFHPYHQPICA